MRTNKQSKSANFRTAAKLGQNAVTRTKFSRLIYNFSDVAVSLNVRQILHCRIYSKQFFHSNGRVNRLKQFEMMLQSRLINAFYVN